MANDVYVKFGRDPNGTTGGPLDTELPDIEGDSTDAHHYWWCELRECGFSIDTPQQADENKSGENSKPASTMPQVTLRKRLDWASTQLFLKCCEAAMATTTKSTDDKGDGRIHEVTVEVCRPAGGDKIPCATVIYYGVRIIKYQINITEPEPAESITFEFDRVKFKYIQTDPSTGEVLNASGLETPELENHHPQTTSGSSSSSGSSPAGSDDASSSSPGSAGNAPTPASPAIAGGGSTPAAGSAPDATVNVNFPGLWQGTGFGLLPD